MYIIIIIIIIKPKNKLEKGFWRFFEFFEFFFILISFLWLFHVLITVYHNIT